ncbi:MAG: hypothetical protein WCF90_10425 [Methanomicrobiales archaeon]
MACARASSSEKALAAFWDPVGQFSGVELIIMVLDYNGTMITNSLSPETAKNHINLIYSHDPDAVPTVREMRNLARNGSGYSNMYAAVKKNGKTYSAPKLDYAEPVDNSSWIFSGIVIPGYEQLREGNTTGITVRNYTHKDMYDLVCSGGSQANCETERRGLWQRSITRTVSLYIVTSISGRGPLMASTLQARSGMTGTGRTG